jgi:hypothetical protein
VKQYRHTPEQIIRKLREAARMLGEGTTIPRGRATVSEHWACRVAGAEARTGAASTVRLAISPTAKTVAWLGGWQDLARVYDVARQHQ